MGRQVPYPSANPGERATRAGAGMGKILSEPHVVGEDGYAYLRLYEMTGNTRVSAQRRFAARDALAKNFTAGDEEHLAVAVSMPREGRQPEGW